ncbi:MAG: hypothetical protein AAGD04_08470 [Pseudomonadota bacterium]
MKRRTFLQTAGAAIATPVVPSLGAAKAAPVAITSHQLMWAEHYARVHNAVSPDLLSSALGFSKEVASALCEKMFSTNIIGSPGAFGVANATNPFFVQGSVPGFRMPSSSKPSLKKALDKLEDTLDRMVEPREPEHESSPLAEASDELPNPAEDTQTPQV